MLDLPNAGYYAERDMASAIQDLIAKKNYARAIDVLKAELNKRSRDVRLRMQYADVLILAGRSREAIPVLLGLADEHASEGFTAKAIAFLKRIEKVEPGRQDVEDRLARLVQEKVSATPGPAARGGPAPAFGLEEFDPNAPAPELSLDVGSVSAPAPEPELTLEPEASAAPVVEAASDDLEGLDAISIEEPAAPSVSQQARSFLHTPLFEGFSQEELAAIIRGLKFLSFEPGDVLVGEGAPGDSMFIIASGSVKAYVRNRKGHFLMVKQLVEGEFFGEVSVITGKPRTATVTAASQVEVLELDKATLDSIAKAHPRVREVLAEYQKKRAQDTVEHILKSKA